MEKSRTSASADDWPSEDWLSEDQLDRVCERAAGLFVYAVTAAKFVDKQYNNPGKRLDLLLRSPEDSAHEGKTRFKSSSTLDLMYRSVLQEAFDNDDPEDDPNIRSALGAMILVTNPLSPSTIATRLGIDIEDVFTPPSSDRSLLILQEGIDHPVRSFHKSFPDFIADPARCIDQRFRVSPPDRDPWWKEVSNITCHFQHTDKLLQVLTQYCGACVPQKRCEKGASSERRDVVVCRLEVNGSSRPQ